MIPFGAQLLWQRVKDYIQAYQPILIGITGATNSHLTQAAITAALQTTYRLRPSVSRTDAITETTVARSILGIDVPRFPHHWWPILSKSFLHELKEKEPEVIPLVLTADEP